MAGELMCAVLCASVVFSYPHHSPYGTYSNAHLWMKKWTQREERGTREIPASAVRTTKDTPKSARWCSKERFGLGGQKTPCETGQGGSHLSSQCGI